MGRPGRGQGVKSDSQAWQAVARPTEDGRGGTWTERMKVPGGWLYRVEVWGEDLTGLALTFVPKVQALSVEMKETTTRE